MKIGVVDLFCGAGGLSYGLREAGLEVVAGADLDGYCKFPFEANCNATFLHKNVKDIAGSELQKLLAGYDFTLLAGCAPCQPFSTYSQSRKSKDDRWNLLNEFKRIVQELSPDLVTMENVFKLSTTDVWGAFVESLKESGYSVEWDIFRCHDFGIPQSRKRLVLIASRLGPVSLPKVDGTSSPRTVADAIAHLPAINHGECDPNDLIHRSSVLSPRNFERIKSSRPGGTWRDWPEDLRANCHIRDTGKSYPSVYGRMEWDKPAPTMTTQFFGYGNGRFGHPSQDRAISLREGAILQSFPDNYQFVEKEEDISIKRLGTLIGNAVPPKLGEEIGKAIMAHLHSYAA